MKTIKWSTFENLKKKEIDKSVAWISGGTLTPKEIEGYRAGFDMGFNRLFLVLRDKKYIKIDEKPRPLASSREEQLRKPSYIGCIEASKV